MTRAKVLSLTPNAVHCHRPVKYPPRLRILKRYWLANVLVLSSRTFLLQNSSGTGQSGQRRHTSYRYSGALIDICVAACTFFIGERCSLNEQNLHVNFSGGRCMRSAWHKRHQRSFHYRRCTHLHRSIGNMPFKSISLIRKILATRLCANDTTTR